METRQAKAVLSDCQVVEWEPEPYEDAQRQWLDVCTNFTGVIGGAKAFNIKGAPYVQVTLGGANTYTGGTIIDGTTVIAGNLAAFGTGAALALIATALLPVVVRR